MKVLAFVVCIQFLLIQIHVFGKMVVEINCQVNQKEFLHKLFLHEIYKPTKNYSVKLRRCKNKMKMISKLNLIHLKDGSNVQKFNIHKLWPSKF
ncbi:MAG: hypothetical protein HN576_15230 [Bacteriovoracaceae bacterium]|jgi:hypothetical protein|nr:hypothetical protein [Bacteriovoracaceae bacterium]